MLAFKLSALEALNPALVLVIVCIIYFALKGANQFNLRARIFLILDYYFHDMYEVWHLSVDIERYI